MGIRSNVQGNRYAEFERRANGRFTKKMEEVERVMEEVFQQAERTGREIIGSAGVQDTVPTGGARGHGALESSFQHRVRRRGDTVIGQAGFIPGTLGREEQRIYSWQESGTRGYHTNAEGQPEPHETPGNRGIRPMLAVHQANREARDELDARLRRK